MSAEYKVIEQIPVSIKLKNVDNKMVIECDFYNSKILICKNENDVKFYKVSNDKMEDFLSNLKTTHVDMNKAVVTGLCQEWARKLIDKIFQIKTEAVDSTVALSKGYEIIRNCCNDSETEYESHHPILQELDVYKVDPNNPFIKRIRMRHMALANDAIKTNDTGILIRPAIIVQSTDCILKIFLLDVDGSMKLLNISHFGEMTIKGLAKSLTNENNYEAIAHDSITGNRENIDTQVHEMIDDDPSGPYGQFPPNLPIFNFGKGMDKNIGQETVSSGDLLDSLLAMMFGEIMIISLVYNRMYKSINIYLSGSFFNTTEFERLISLRMNSMNTGINVKLLRGDYVSCIGALNAT